MTPNKIGAIRTKLEEIQKESHQVPEVVFNRVGKPVIHNSATHHVFGSDFSISGRPEYTIKVLPVITSLNKHTGWTTGSQLLTIYGSGFSLLNKLTLEVKA